jgi:hypothetical protein
MHLIIVVLNDLDVTRPLFSALRVFLEESAAPQGNQSISKRFRLHLLAFACELKEYISGSSSHWLKSTFIDLQKAALDLRPPGASFEGELDLLTLKAIHLLNLLIDAFREDDSNMFTNYLSVRPFVTLLASECSALGWLHEAEVLFIVFRTSLEANNFFPTQLAVQYCLHLEREKRYGEILSVIHDTYTYTYLSNIYVMDAALKSILSVPAEQCPHLLTMRDFMNHIPRPLNKHISSNKVNQLATLVNFFHGEGRRFDCEENEDSSEGAVTENNELDCESSIKFGVTYPESVITGISFKYSDLYK